MIIEDIILRRILDSRGNPTVEAEIISTDSEEEFLGRAAVPKLVTSELSALCGAALPIQGLLQLL